MDFDLETEWPELMKLLTPPQYFAIRRAIAAAWHEGWDPNLMDVELLVRYIRDEGELPLPAPIDGPETEYVFDTWDSYFQLVILACPFLLTTTTKPTRGYSNTRNSSRCAPAVSNST